MTPSQTGICPLSAQFLGSFVRQPDFTYSWRLKNKKNKPKNHHLMYGTGSELGHL